MDNRAKAFIIILIAILSVTITVVVASKMLDATGKVNQGNYRISDLVIESCATVKEVQGQDVEVKNLTDYVYDITQTNEVSILIEANTDAKSIEIQNIKVSDPLLKGNMTIGQSGKEQYDITPELTNININVEKREDEKYIVDLLIDNNVLTGQKVPEDATEVQYDAKMFKLLGVNTDELKFNVSFDLVITDNVGKKVKTSLELSMPTDETFEKGMSILKQDASKYIFTFVK